MAVSVMIMQTAANLWIGAFWPTVAALMYILIVLFSGNEMLYRTAVPVWIMSLCCVIQHRSVLGWIFSLMFCIGYTYAISGKVNKAWLLPLYLLGLGGCVYTKSVPDGLAVLGMLLLYPAIRVHNDGKWHSTWGDRIDGRRVRIACLTSLLP